MTFTTELGDVDTLLFDVTSMTGTAISGTVTENTVGVAPQFNSLDQDSGLPLGSLVIADLTTLSATVAELDEGISYYFRVAAVNSIGQSDYAFAPTPYAIPQDQRPSEPTSATLEVVDGTSMTVAFNPLLDGGEDVTFYRGNMPLPPLNQRCKVKAACDIIEEVQTVTVALLSQLPMLRNSSSTCTRATLVTWRTRSRRSLAMLLEAPSSSPLLATRRTRSRTFDAATLRRNPSFGDCQ